MELGQSLQEKIDFEQSKEVIQYYQYLRNITELTQLPYWIGNPSVEIISGKILLEPFAPIRTKKEPESFQLYLKEILRANRYGQSGQQRKQIYDISQPVLNRNISQNSQEQRQATVQEKADISSKHCNSRCLILCGIPNSKPPIEVTETQCLSRYLPHINQIRIIKTVHIKYYAMLLLMKNQESTEELFNELFGQQYNGLQMERIVLRQVKEISLSFSGLVKGDGGSNEMNLLRAVNENEIMEFVRPENIFMTFHYQKMREGNKMKEFNNQPNQLKENNEISQNKKFEEKNDTNQLVCAICFEQCTNQAISILCGHYFDLCCLQKWSQAICPLCRYHQQPPVIKFCQKCNQCEGLWVCLICGERLCCGVNNNILGEDSHIYDHFKLTGHSLSMELQTKFLFDAKIPAFLHQKFYRDLINGEREEMHSQGGSIEMVQKQSQQKSKKSKITQQIQEYQSQVSQQMKRQRHYFEEQINKSLRQHRRILSQKRQQIQHLRSQAQGIDDEEKLTQIQINTIEQNIQKKSKELEIVKNLIRLKQQKVQQKRQSIVENQKLKVMRLKEIDAEIREKREEILNYRKNLKLKERLAVQLKGEEVKGEFVVGVGEHKNQKKRKKGNK